MVHIQIILYNSIKNLSLLIKGFEAIPEKENFEIHFLENSDENSEDFLKDMQMSFKYTYDCNNKNLGFGKGNNFLFKKYGKDYGEYFIILNPDILPFYNFLKELEEFQSANTTNWGLIELTQFPEEHPKDYRLDYKTDFASGAAVVIKKDLFKKVKGFDDNIFMYCEDVDLSWKIKELGYHVLHCPKSKIAHIIGGSSRDSQELQNSNNSLFQTIHMHAGNLYLRHKYFGEIKINEYKKQIELLPESDKILEQFNKMKKGLTDKDLIQFRGYKSPKIYPDGNYGKHRW